MIGLRVVAADGQLVRAGGKVVKNVAGYDLVKLYIGPSAPSGSSSTRRSSSAPVRIGGGLLGLVSYARCGGLRGGGPRRSELGPVALALLDPLAAEACAVGAGLPPAAAPALFRRVRRACQRGRVGA